MAIGKGEYDSLCTQARIASNAHGVILIVLGGERGSGFSVQMHSDDMARLPKLLRKVADEIERDHGELSKLELNQL